MKISFIYLGWEIFEEVSYFARKGNQIIYAPIGGLDDLLFELEKRNGRDDKTANG